MTLQITILINKVFYSKGKTGGKFCLPAIGKALREKSKSEVLSSEFFNMCIFFCIILMLVSQAEP